MDSVQVIRVGPHWRTYRALKHLVVFGASYCEVGYYDARSPHPCAEQPLGVDFPGETWAEHGQPNWVGHLTREFSPSGSFNTDPLLVYDYARGGQRVTGVRHQVEKMFLPAAGQRPEWVPWTPDDTLFCTWVGINDCAFTNDISGSIKTLFDTQDTLYANGARNFMLINLPPMLRSPMGRSRPMSKEFQHIAADPYEDWNTHLRASAEAFAARHSDATVLVFSAWDLFSGVLGDPVRFGFAENDPGKKEGGIWVDQLHPTSAMHRVIAKGVYEFLSSVKGLPEGQQRVEGEVWA